MGKYFGTDGVRAVAGQFPLVDDFIQKLGYAALRELQEYAKNEHLKPQVIIAQDSRASGPAILASLEKGIRASGAVCAGCFFPPATTRLNLTVLNFLPITVRNSPKSWKTPLKPKLNL